MKTSILITILVLSGCASQLDLREGDCSITLVDIDANAATPVVGSVEADGKMLVQRGTCSKELIDMFIRAVQNQ